MDCSPKKLSTKRLDLQGIRGLAIISVLGFHFYPSTFPNGYLGVDQFFVLSGFLMCMLLKKAEKETPCTLITIFYTKRFKRILPLYLLVIFCAMICLYAFFSEDVVEINQESAFRALLFVSNTPKTKVRDYFMMLTNAMDIFTHTWSLSLEIQYYFLIPFIFLIASRLPTKLEIAYYALIGIISFSFFFLLSQSLAFNSVFARVWQFCIGIIIYLLDNSMRQNGGTPLELPKGVEEFESLLIDNDMLLVALVTSILLAVLFFEIFEKWYLNLTSISLTLLIVLLFISSVALVQRDYFFEPRNDYFPSLENITANMTIDDVIRLNADWNKNDLKNLNVSYCKYETEGPLDWCSHMDLNAKSKYKLAIIGNSWTANHGTLFHQECGKKANTIIQGSFANCEMIYPSLGQEGCRDYYNSFNLRIQKEKPDYLFLISSFFVFMYVSIGDPMPKNVTKLSEDPIYQLMKAQLFAFLSNTKHKIYILNALPAHDRKQTKKIGEWLKDGVTAIEIQRRLGNKRGKRYMHTSYEMARKRYGELVNECNGRCVLIDYKAEFYNNATGMYTIFDERGIEYFTSVLHLSAHGLEKIRHIWKDVCANL